MSFCTELPSSSIVTPLALSRSMSRISFCRESKLANRGTWPRRYWQAQALSGKVGGVCGGGSD